MAGELFDVPYNRHPTEAELEAAGQLQMDIWHRSKASDESLEQGYKRAGDSDAEIGRVALKSTMPMLIEMGVIGGAPDSGELGTNW